MYNTSAYDSEESVRLLDGIVDIYMPDFKFWRPDTSLRYCKARDYPEVAKRSIKAMHEQVGDLLLDPSGLAKRGLIIRHLVMPGMVEESKAIVRYLERYQCSSFWKIIGFCRLFLKKEFFF